MSLPSNKVSLKNPYEEYYRTRYIASVQFRDGKMYVEQGKRELVIARGKTSFCFVKDLQTGEGVKLVLSKNKWVKSPEAEC